MAVAKTPPIVDSAMNTGAPAPAPAATSSATPPTPMSAYEAAMKKYASQPIATGGGATRSIDAKTGTVQGQVASILAKDGPLAQRARAAGLEQAAGRGLINSSMAIDAAHGAVMDRAIQIGTPDAQHYNDASRDNQNAANQASMFNAGESNSFGRLALTELGSTSRQDRQFAFEAGENANQRKFTSGENALNRSFDLTKMDKGQGFDLAKMDKGQGFDLAKMDKGQGFDLAKMDKGQGFDLAKMDKGQGFDLAKMDKGQGFDLAKMDKGQLFDLVKMDKGQGFDLAKMKAGQGFSLEQMAVAQGYTAENMAAATKDDLLKMSAANGLDLEKMAVSQGYNVANMDKQQLMDFAKMDKGQLLDLTKMDKAFDQNTALNAAQFGYQKELAAIANTYGTQSTAFTAAANAINNGASQVASILADPNISNDGDPSPKQQLIDRVQAAARSTANVYAALSGADYSAFFAGATAAPPPPAPAPPPPAPPAPGIVDDKMPYNPNIP